MGRRIWIIDKGGRTPNSDTGEDWINPPCVSDGGQVLKFRQFLPRGPIYQDKLVVGTRDRSLVQVYCDPGGVRTIAVASISLKDPGRSKR